MGLEDGKRGFVRGVAVVAGLSASMIRRLKGDWEQKSRRDLSHKQYARIWADGV